MSATLVLAIAAGVVVLLLLGVAALAFSKNSGRPRMSKWERQAINRETNKYLERKAAERAFQMQAEAMGYDTSDGE